MSRKPHPERVDPVLARAALAETAGHYRSVWTSYIVRHFRETGKSLPGCDMRDLQEFYRLEARP